VFAPITAATVVFACAASALVLCTDAAAGAAVLAFVLGPSVLALICTPTQSQS